MTHREGEQRVKALQRRFLCYIEEHEATKGLDPVTFNNVRKQLYRATFWVFKLGVVGFPDEQQDPDLFTPFFGWIYHPSLNDLSFDVTEELRSRCFRTALEVYRIGAQVEVGE